MQVVDFIILMAGSLLLSAFHHPSHNMMPPLLLHTSGQEQRFTLPGWRNASSCVKSHPRDGNVQFFPFALPSLMLWAIRPVSQITCSRAGVVNLAWGNNNMVFPALFSIYVA